MNSDGSIAEEAKYDNTLTEAQIFAYSIVKKYGQCVAVCESTSNIWLKTYQVVKLAVKVTHFLCNITSLGFSYCF
jgi:hypothetical protein